MNGAKTKESGQRGHTDLNPRVRLDSSTASYLSQINEKLLRGRKQPLERPVQLPSDAPRSNQAPFATEKSARALA